MSHHFKSRPRPAAFYLPKRNKREVLLRRTAALIKTQAQLDEVLAAQPENLRANWMAVLAPYLSFSPAWNFGQVSTQQKTD